VLTFAVVALRSGGRVPVRVANRLRDQRGFDLPFEARQHRVWSNEAGTVWFAGWQDTADAEAGAHHWSLDDDGLTAFAGDVWPRGDGWTGVGPWAAQLADRLRSTPMTADSDDLAGVFVAASLSAHGRSVIGTDPLGVGVAYWGEDRDMVVISTRAPVAAGLLAAEVPNGAARDVVGSGWLAYSTYPVGDRTGFECVRVVPEGACIAIDAAGNTRLNRAEQSPWRSADGLPNSPTAVLEQVRAEMTAAMRMARRRPGQMAAGLTGGKDSRLILALLLADGAAGDVEFQTYGGDELPDVVIARRLADTFGLHHVTNPGFAQRWEWRQALEAAVRDRGGYADVSSRELGLRITPWTMSGVRNVSEAHLGRMPSVPSALLSGGFGELLRTNFPGSTRLRSKEQAARFPDELKFGTAQILRPELLEDYRERTHRVLFEGCRDSDSPQDVIDAFYIRARLRRWLGAEIEVDPQPRVFPLYSITAVRLAFAIGAENRHSEWIHYQLMRTAYEPLVHADFANDDWRPEARGGLVPMQPDHERCPSAPPPMPAPVEPTSKLSERTWARDVRAELQQTDREIMRRYLCHDPSNPVFEVVDPVAIQTAVDRFEQLSESQRLQVYGALSAAIWLGGFEIPLHN
jgi:hypothetical protein